MPEGKLKMAKGPRYNYAALLLCAMACCGWSYVLAIRYYRFAYDGWDLPLYANLMWNLCHGSLSTSLFGGNFFMDHFNAIAFLLVPLYYFFQSALTLLYFKLFAFFAGAYIFYLLAARRVGGLWAIAIMLAYMFYPANVAMLFFEFNFENLALPLIFFLFYYFDEKKFLSFMVCCFLLTTVKENMPLVVFMFGIYAFWARREDRLRWCLFPLLLGGGMFILEVFVFIPWVRHGLGNINTHLDLYSWLGETPLGIVRALLFKAPVILKILFNGHNLSFLSQLFGPLLITALLAPQILLIGSPLFLLNLLSLVSLQQSINYYYSSTLTVFIFMTLIAAIDSLGGINKKFILINTMFKGHFLLIMVSLLFIYEIGYMPQWSRKVTPFQEKQAVKQYFLSQIPPDGKVICSYEFLPMLSQRKEVYILLFKQSWFSSQKVEIPYTDVYTAVDFSTVMENKTKFRDIITRYQWKVQAAADEVVLLRSNSTRGEKLISGWRERPLSWPGPFQPVIMAADALRMEGLEIPRSLKFGRRVLRVVYYWKALSEDQRISVPPIILSIFQGPKTVYSKSRTPFYGLPFKQPRHYKEVYYYFIPKLSPGNYIVVINFMASPAVGLNPTSQTGVFVKNISVLAGSDAKETE